MKVAQDEILGYSFGFRRQVPQGRLTEPDAQKGFDRKEQHTSSVSPNSRGGYVTQNTMAQKQITVDEIRKEVRRLVAEITEREPEEVSDTALFQEDLGIDSLMAIEMLVAVDKKYRIQIPEEEFAAIKNVNDAVTLVERHLAAKSS